MKLMMMNDRLNLAKRLICAARELVAKDWTREIKSKLPHLDENMVKEINAMLQGYHNPKKERIVAYWMLEKKTIEYPFSQKTKSIIDMACKRALDSFKNDEFHKIDYKKYNSPMELLNEESAPSEDPPDDRFDQEKQWTEKYPDLIDLFMQNMIQHFMTWKEECEFMRMFMNSDKSEQDRYSDPESVSELIETIRKMDAISIEDFTNLREYRNVLCMLCGNDEAFWRDKGTCRDFIDRLIEKDKDAAMELAKKAIHSIWKLDWLVYSIIHCKSTPSNVLSYLWKNGFGKYQAVLAYLPEHDNFTDTSLIDMSGNTFDKQFLNYHDMLGKMKPSMKKYAYEKYGDMPIRKMNGETVAMRIAKGICGLDHELVGICDDKSRNVRMILAKNNRMPMQFYLRLIKDDDIEIAKTAVISASNYWHETESVIMAIAGDSRMAIRRMLVKYSPNASYYSKYLDYMRYDGLLKYLKELLSHGLDSKTKCDIVKFDKTPHQIITRLAKDDDWTVRAEVAMLPGITGKDIKILSADKNANVLKALINNKNTPADLVEELFPENSPMISGMTLREKANLMNHRSDLPATTVRGLYESFVKDDLEKGKDDDVAEFMCAASWMRNASPEILDRLFEDYDRKFGEYGNRTEAFLYGLMRNPSVPLELLAKIETRWKHTAKYGEWREQLMKYHPGFEKDEAKYKKIIKRLLAEEDNDKAEVEMARSGNDQAVLRDLSSRRPELAKLLAENPNTPADILAEYVKRADLKTFVFNNLGASEETLDLIADDPDEDIRYFSMFNPSIGLNTLRRMALNDPKPGIRNEAKKLLERRGAN